MSAILVLAALSLPPLWAEENCVVCHGREALQLARSVHGRSAGITCTACHGGDPLALEVEAAHAGRFDALSDARTAVLSCGECHADIEQVRISGLRTDQLALYRTSRHGLALFESGDAGVATCADCHGAHDILRAEDPLSSVHPRNQAATCGSCHGDAELMQTYGLGSDAPELYNRSVHGRGVAAGLLASPTCSDCHGHHGALPPRVDQTEQVCGQCHSIVDEHFRASPHFRSTESRVQCADCHGHHLVTPPSSELFAAGPGGCGSCHAEEPGALEVAAGLRARLEGFEARIETVAQSVEQAALRGLYLDQELGFLDDARSVLVRARSLSHSSSLEDLDEFLNRGQGMIAQTEDSLATRSRTGRDRRIFTALFFVLSLALGVMLGMYAREIRGPEQRRARASGGP